MNGFVVRPLKPEDASTLAEMLRQQPADYMQYFVPFDFDASTISRILAVAERDLYLGIFWQGRLAGFFMLRGWDEGFEIPSYGVTIGYEFKDFGLGRLTLDMAKTISRLRGAKRLMLKVHPENRAAQHLYESGGFVRTGVDQRNDNLVYHFDLVESNT